MSRSKHGHKHIGRSACFVCQDPARKYRAKHGVPAPDSGLSEDDLDLDPAEYANEMIERDAEEFCDCIDDHVCSYHAALGDGPPITAKIWEML